MLHDLRIYPEYFEAILSGDKTFEIREDKRNYKRGDTLLLQEYANGKCTGREVRKRISYVYRGDGQFGLPAGYCALGLKDTKEATPPSDIVKSPTIEKALEFSKEIFEGNSDGHDFSHTLRVHHNTITIAQTEPDCDIETAALAAILHDVDDHKLFTTSNNANARAFLEKIHLNSHEIETICSIINSVSFSKNREKSPENIEGRVVQDADRLDAIGAVGIARTFAYGGRHGRSIEDSLEHFHEKLLKLKDLMNTDAGKQLAEQRHDFLLNFLREYEEEIIYDR